MILLDKLPASDSINTIAKNGGRYYNIADGIELYSLPSVTTIIGSMSDSTWLEEWKKRIGEKEAEKISQYSVRRGELMHLMCEKFCSFPFTVDKKERVREAVKFAKEYADKNGMEEKEFISGRGLFYNFFLCADFDKIREIVMQESPLYSLQGGGYAGRVDMIYYNRKGELIVADYKTSKKPKRYEDIDSYKMQIAAYTIAFWELTGERPHHGEIWISNESDHLSQIFDISFSEIKIFYKRFIEMVKGYHEKFKINQIT